MHGCPAPDRIEDVKKGRWMRDTLAPVEGSEFSGFGPTPNSGAPAHGAHHDVGQGDGCVEDPLPGGLERVTPMADSAAQAASCPQAR